MELTDKKLVSHLTIMIHLIDGEIIFYLRT